MNAGRDVERLIAGWLEDEAAVRAPDRVLESARRAIDRTRQRRVGAAWRETMTTNLLRWPALAAVLIVATVGAAWVGGYLPGTGAVPTPSPSPTPTTLAAYRLARNQICSRYGAELEPMKSDLEGIFDPDLSAADRATKVATLTTYVVRSEAMARELSGIAAPPEIAQRNAMTLSDIQTVNSMIRDVIALVGDGKINQAAALDFQTDPFSTTIYSFEDEFGLEHCP